MRLLAACVLAVTSAPGTLPAGEQGNALCQFPGDGQTGHALRYRALSDGTVLDLNTGLVWERKDTGSGIHGVNRLFTWSDGWVEPDGTVITTAEPDGTAFTIFLDTLNNKCSGDETTSCTKNADCQGNGKCGYGGHRDWRMPNVKELVSIVDYGQFQPAIDPILGATRPPDVPGPRYWSSTTYAAHQDFAVFVNFDTGYASNDGKSFTFWGPHGLLVRAVRNGECQR